MVAMVRGWNGQTGDSIRYYYSSPNRGAYHNPKNWFSYDEDFDPTRTGLSLLDRTHRQYIQHDSAVRFMDTVSGVFFAESRNTHLYNAANQPVERIINHNGGMGNFRFQMSYDAAGRKLYTERAFDTAGSTPATFYQTDFTVHSKYDAAGRHFSDSSHYIPFGQSGIEFYTWSPAGMLTQSVAVGVVGSSLDTSHRMTVSYNADGLIVRLLHEEKNGNGLWLPEQLDSIGYAGANPAYTWARSYSRWGNQWRLSSRSEYHLNNAGNWDTVRHFSYSAGHNSLRFVLQQVITYNADQNRERMHEYFDNDNNNLPDPIPYVTRYYYELWNDPLRLPEKPATEENAAVVYPNPIIDEGVAVVRWRGNAPAIYRLIDAAGRIVRNGEVVKGATHLSLDFSGLPSGVYVFRGIDASGQPVCTARVVHY
jgi:hypothetical protein